MLRPEALTDFTARMDKAYHMRFGKAPRVDLCHPSAGAGEIADPETVPAAAR